MDLKDTILETLQEIEESAISEEELSPSTKCDKEFLKHIKERILVLFEGLQSPNTENLDIKLDVTLNFLEYLLVKIDEKLSNNGK
jgi:hypothetical protein